MNHPYDPDVFLRDNIVLGDPDSGSHQISLTQLRQYLKWLERYGDAIIVSSLPELKGVTGSRDNAKAEVRGARDKSENGFYRWRKVVSDWVKVADLDASLARLEITGTANELTATLVGSLEGGNAVVMVGTAMHDNGAGGTFVTIDGVREEILNAAGESLGAKHLIAGQAFLLVRNDETLHCYLSGDALAAAQRASTAQAVVEAYAQNIVRTQFDEISDVHVNSIEEVVNYIDVHSVNGVGGIKLKRSADEPAHSAKVQSADGAWWEFLTHYVTPQMLGAAGDAVETEAGWTGTDDSAAIIAAGEVAVKFGIPLRFTANHIWNSTSQWEPSGRITIYAQNPQKDGITITSDITRSVQTNITHPSDGMDAPISIFLKITHAYSEVKGLRLHLNFDGLNSSDYGADVDCGIFVRSVPFCKVLNNRVTGYWREAGCYFDNTQDGQSVTVDFSKIESNWFQGKWGFRIEGAEPQSGQTELASDDMRGRGGASDMYIANNRIWGMNHHSGVRFSDTDGGSVRVNGKLFPGVSSINAIKGRYWFGNKMQSAEPFALQLDAAIGDKFFGGSIDRSTGYVKTDGVTGVGTNDQVYQTTARTKHLEFHGVDIFRATADLAPGTYSITGGMDETDSFAARQYFLPALGFTGVTYIARAGHYTVRDGIVDFRLSIDVETLDNTDASAATIAGFPDGLMNNTHFVAQVDVGNSTLLKFVANDALFLVPLTTANGFKFVNAAGADIPYNSGGFNASGTLFITGRYWV